MAQLSLDVSTAEPLPPLDQVMDAAAQITS
jgi:hypothetical protein